MKWIQLPDQNYYGKVVHEVKCPVCKHCETYHGDKIPTKCFLCETELKGDEKNEL